MKIFKLILVLSLLIICSSTFAQTDKASIYITSKKLYEKKNYGAAAKAFDSINSGTLSTGKLYQGACIYALNSEYAKAFALLDLLADQKYYSNYEHISADEDLVNLHNDVKWDALLKKVRSNLSDLPKRKLETIYTQLMTAKQLLTKDAGGLWGEPIWSDDIFVLDYDNTIYALTPFPGSLTNDHQLYYAHVPVNTFAFVNTIQSYQGKEYATVLYNYLSDHSITIIHELFHLLQLKNMKLSGDAVAYLDQFDARELLRLEYQALRNSLSSIVNKSPKMKITSFLEDALLFRKLRQATYSGYLQKELEIETLEGLANYTGFTLSTAENKYEAAIEEIYQRENSETYTRPFPYATGVAYGLIFDHLGLNWKTGLKHVYNFLSIYEVNKLIDTSPESIMMAKRKNSFEQIHQEEIIRRDKNDRLINYYRNLLLVKPTVSVQIGENYGRTFNMNGTIEIPGTGTVYSSIQGRDKSGKNFGNFTTIEDFASLGKAGILLLKDYKTLVFPAPIKIIGKKVIGETYEIELNEGWTVEKNESDHNFTIKTHNF